MSTPQSPDPSGALPPLPPVPPAPAGRESLADAEWHRLHPLTPLFKGGLVLIIVAGIVLNNFRDRIIYWGIGLFAPEEANVGDYAGGDPVDWVLENNLILIALLVILGVLIVLIALFWMVWRFQEFRISDEHVEVRKGIIFRSQRRAPLDRVQGVNLTRPFPARLIGMAKLEVVGAGTDANVPLEYLSTTKAETVRSDILHLASGARAAREARQQGRSVQNPGSAGAATIRSQLIGSMNGGVNDLIGGVDLGDVVPESVVKIPTGRLIGSQVLAGVLWLVFFLVVFAVFIATMLPIALANEDGDGRFVLLGAGLGVGIPFIIAAVAITWAQISKSLRYSIAPTPDGVRITFGLFTTVTETIPPGRIFAVEVTQSILWRPFGWWTIKINRMSGKSASQQQSSTAQQFNVVLPVGTRADVERVLALVLPDMPVEDRPLVWEHGILGPQAGDPYQVLQKRGGWRRPFSWKRHGFAVTDFAVIMRRGNFWRKLAVFPLARLQGVSAAQGPIDRAQRVAILKAHSVTGPVLGDVVGIESVELTAAVDDISRRAAAAAGRDHSHRWAQDAAHEWSA
ncbi:PH domain-containing protein [Microbacterium profundi]|uniref:PH domain-containing protein n=1 Tax=Microbacterium profundi TaxID=450380 RepID=UPI0027E12D72|nr:PH domain-containing protein [Microbacterium profundi]MCE7481164.1 PH domain-containing protein [Microbacterium profundi]